MGIWKQRTGCEKYTIRFKRRRVRGTAYVRKGNVQLEIQRSLASCCPHHPTGSWLWHDPRNARSPCCRSSHVTTADAAAKPQSRGGERNCGRGLTWELASENQERKRRGSRYVRVADAPVWSVFNKTVASERGFVTPSSLSISTLSLPSLVLSSLVSQNKDAAELSFLQSFFSFGKD